MNLRTFLIAGISALFGLCLAVVIVRSASAQIKTGDLIDDTKPVERRAAMPLPVVGRYQVAPVPHSIGGAPIMYDTTTGKAWFFNGGNWQHLCDPPESK